MIWVNRGLSRRGWLTTLAATCCLAIGLTATPASAKPLGTAAVLGDGYSVKKHDGVPSWSTQLGSQKVLTVTTNRAVESALASGVSGPKSLLGQVDAYLTAVKGKPAKYTFIYFGNADLLGNKDVAVAKANYATAVDKLVAAGATTGTNRLVLVRLHDLTYNPGVPDNVRKKVVDFNKTIASIVSSRPNVLTVNLGALFDAVIANPAAYGLTNVTTPDPKKSKTTALYHDKTHFGQKGQSLIAAEVKKVLSPPAPVP